MALLLHLNLQNTTLDDLADHIRNGLDYGGVLMPHSPRTIEGVLGGKIPYEWYFKESSREPVIVLQEAELAPTNRIFGVRYIDQFRIQETLVLQIKRYRTDVLRVFLYLDLDHANSDRDTAAFAPKTLLNWLRPQWGDAVIELPIEDAPIKQVRSAFGRPSVYGGTDYRTTVVHYLVTYKGLTQTVACGLVGVAERTYRKHRDKNKLIDNKEFERRYGETIEKAARKCR